MGQEQFTVEHRPEEARYVLLDTGADTAQEAGQEQYLELDGDGEPHRIFFHTVVKEAYGGQGLASKLVQAAVEDAIASGAKVVPVCPYVVAWAKKHPEFADHIVTARPEHLNAVSDMRR